MTQTRLHHLKASMMAGWPWGGLLRAHNRLLPEAIAPAPTLHPCGYRAAHRCLWMSVAHAAGSPGPEAHPCKFHASSVDLRGVLLLDSSQMCGCMPAQWMGECCPVNCVGVQGHEPVLCHAPHQPSSKRSTRAEIRTRFSSTSRR